MEQFEHYLNRVRTRVNESSDNDKAKMDSNVLAFLVKYGPKYIDNDASILEFLQNTDEDNANDEYCAKLKAALQDARSANEASKLRSVTVEYGDGSKMTTSMAAHLTDDDIRNYFKIGKVFNLGNAPVPGDGNYGDNMQPVTSVVINESVNEGLNKADLVNILEKYTTWLVKTEKMNTPNVADLVSQFMGITESVNENYNMMVVTVPPVDQWLDVQVSSIIGDTVKAFEFMGKRYYIRAKDIDMFTANVGKPVKFKYDKDALINFMEFATPANES